MKKTLFTVGLFMCTCAGCTKFDESTTQAQYPDETVATATPQTRAGASFTTLPDPYSLANMQAVYRNYGSNRTLQATHKYVRFKPQNQEQMNRLEEVYDLDLYDYPLDIEIPDGVEYIDLTISEGEMTWRIGNSNFYSYI